MQWDPEVAEREAEIARKRPWVRRILKVLALLVAAFLAVCLLGVLLFRWTPVPATALMLSRRLEPGGRSQSHTWVPLEEIAPSLGLAVLAAEDQNFTEHSGLDWQAI